MYQKYHWRFRKTFYKGWNENYVNVIAILQLSNDLNCLSVMLIAHSENWGMKKLFLWSDIVQIFVVTDVKALWTLSVYSFFKYLNIHVSDYPTGIAFQLLFSELFTQCLKEFFYLLMLRQFILGLPLFMQNISFGNWDILKSVWHNETNFISRKNVSFVDYIFFLTICRR